LPDVEPKYAKASDDVRQPLPRRSSRDDNSEFVLRITLGDMPIDDAFWILLPCDLSSLTLGELFESLLGADESMSSAFRQRLDLKRNPDLADMYDSLVDIHARKQAGLCTVDAYQNFGPKLADSADVHRFMREQDGPPLLDLILEQRFSAVDYAVRRGDFTDVEHALRWLQSSVLLYCLGEQEYILPIKPINETDMGLHLIADLLLESEDIHASEDSGLLEITDRGRETLHQMIAVVENVLNRYEIFADVLCDAETGECDFGTGRGGDMRIPVYEAEGVDPFRAVFFVELFDGALEKLEDDWRDVIHEREFYDALLMPVTDRPLVDEQILEKIVDAGFLLMDEQVREASESAQNRQLRRTLERD
jgi:hypothetical protein